MNVIQFTFIRSYCSYIHKYLCRSFFKITNLDKKDNKKKSVNIANKKKYHFAMHKTINSILILLYKNVSLLTHL